MKRITTAKNERKALLLCRKLIRIMRPVMTSVFYHEIVDKALGIPARRTK